MFSVILLVQPAAGTVSPVATFTYAPAAPILHQVVVFDASASYDPDGGAIESYKWDFGDENVTTTTSPVINHVYATSANYTVTLNVTDSEGLWNTESKLITVRGIPVAKFTYSPERPIMNELVTFNASLSTSDGGTIVSYFWTCGDGTNGTGMIVNHAYTATGDYTATLTITDSENLTDTAQATLTVRDYPVAYFEYKPQLPLVNETVTFNATLSSPDGGSIVSYRWDFGDDSNTTESDPITTHVYTAFGTYSVTLTITDSEDLTDTFMDTMRILIHPVAHFTYSPTKPIVNETVTFSASASYDPDRSVVSYKWDFGDGNVTTVTYPGITHAYSAEGTYNVTLTITDDDGLTDTVSKLVTVYTEVPVHDIVITSVTTSAAEVYVGWVVNVTVVVRNKGTEVESLAVTVYYDVTSVGTKTVPTLLPSSEITLVLNWNTAEVTPCLNYTISANATITTPGVDGDDYPNDNLRVSGKVYVRLTCDVNGDGNVDVSDLLNLKITVTKIMLGLPWP